MKIKQQLFAYALGVVLSGAVLSLARKDEEPPEYGSSTLAFRLEAPLRRELDVAHI